MQDWNYKNFWEESLILLKKEQGEDEFNLWYGKLEYIRSEESVIFASVPTNFFLQMFKPKYLPQLEKKIVELSGKKLSVSLEVQTKRKTIQDPQTQPEQKPAQNTIKSQNPVSITPKNTEKKENHPDLQEEYTFDRYVVGELNNYAFSAASAVARNPGNSKIYNPLLIYGGTGLGKTHLMQAIGHHIHQNSSNKILYITGEGFMREYVELMKSNVKNKDAFAKKYRSVDALLIDDIHTISIQAKGTIDELFYTFEALHNKKKQIVFTCDRPITEMKSIPDRMKSRFTSGLSVELILPKYEELFAILTKKVEFKKKELNKDIHISDEIIELIIKNISSNVRDMEGAINNLMSYSALVDEPITMEIAQRQLKDVFADPKQENISIDIIQKVVAEEYGLTLNDLKGKKRSASIVKPRQMAIYLCRELTEYSLTEIGEFFGGRDHATVIHSHRTIEEKIRSDTYLYTALEKLKQKIKELTVK